ncbi:transglycosylase family protein [Prauserella rugosa]|uniref:Putative peptidoglycan binding protein n=1 Tax=Prauserella rugosa TaxID=43354 RepID=A0A660CAD8_9PSEU|nr:transglycosylase family protein [Prauserella rugosa]TWH19314.1 putative peptidoglycan binding protein [Prauserella rugosa]
MDRRRFRGLTRGFTKLLLIAMAALGVHLALAVPTAADPSRSDWAKLRMCESTERYHVNTGTGYYGAYQFDLPTWRSVGGQGRPDQASPAEQDYRALYLYRMRGWQPWECANMVGLVDDADARSKVVPSRGDAAYIGGRKPAPVPAPAPQPAPGPAPAPEAKPAWSGLVYAYGDCAPALRTFQLRMNDLGYDFQGTGCYYDKTKQAVLDLQRANDIRDSGRLGPKTWKAAWEGVAPR